MSSHSRPAYSHKFSLTTNIYELPNPIFKRIAIALNNKECWMKIADDRLSAECATFNFSAHNFDRVSRASNPGSSALMIWANRGLTVKQFLKRLQELSKIYGCCMDEIQLHFGRQFVSLFWSRSEQVVLKPMGSEGRFVELICTAKGFPTPFFQWLEAGVAIRGANERSFIISRCQCEKNKLYSCHSWNEILDDRDYSIFYRKPGKQYRSDLVSSTVSLLDYFTNDKKVNFCERCKISPSLCSRSNEFLFNHATSNVHNEKLAASDKVALIISNCNYDNLPKLVTPHCDAETLAQGLQELSFKTVTLADLNHQEMIFFIEQYRKLLGAGVYAIFYFAGHGFEICGRNYLLPIDAPNRISKEDDCISLDMVLEVFRNSRPALNLILLDVCRKVMSCDVSFEKSCRTTDVNIARNTVYGYATSSGVSAFEVRGERNGVFMKHIKSHLRDQASVIDVLTQTFQDISTDGEIGQVQIPELRSNLTLPRSLLDPIICDGHTMSFNHHTFHWRYMHELPNPTHITFEDLFLSVTVWYDFVGHFTNKVYLFSNVEYINGEAFSKSKHIASSAADFYVARVELPQFLAVSKGKVIVDGVEGVSLCVVLSNLQRSKGPLLCKVKVCRRQNGEVASEKENIELGDVLITRIYRTNHLTK